MQTLATEPKHQRFTLQIKRLRHVRLANQLCAPKSATSATGDARRDVMKLYESACSMQQRPRGQDGDFAEATHAVSYLIASSCRTSRLSSSLSLSKARRTARSLATLKVARLTCTIAPCTHLLSPRFRLYALGTMVAEGIIKGVDDGTLVPDGDEFILSQNVLPKDSWLCVRARLFELVCVCVWVASKAS